MRPRRILRLLLISVAAAYVGFALGEWAGSLSGAGWWQPLPWLLLAPFWTGLGIMLWRQRRRPQG